MAEVSMVQALNTALRDALSEDPKVVVYGEDVGRAGGIFGVTAGLQASFGADRVFDTPIAEAGFVGAAIGLSMRGYRPVVELQFDGFAYPALEQVISHVSKYRNRVRGAFDLPIVLRMPAFGGVGGKEHHGESPETFYAHTPGLKVVAPSGALDAYRIMRLAITDPDPVVVLEPKARYRSVQVGELTTEGPGIYQAVQVRDGNDLAITAYGSMVERALAAAQRLADESGAQARVIDLRSLAPLDADAIARAVRETGRLVVVHEAPRALGIGAEVTALAVEHAFDALRAPVQRVTGWDTPYPPASLEERWIPTPERIVAACRRTLS
jgi:2-oxoisovalerate dehydrogenase E1 component subunit beta